MITPVDYYILESIVLLVLISITITVLAILLRIQSNAAVYPRGGTSSYQYAFGKQAKTLTVSITSDYFIWPELDADWDTAFLKIDVHSEWPGKLFEPYIRFSFGQQQQYQYLERDCSGTRYFNVSALKSNNIKSGDKVFLKGHFINWHAQKAELIVFNNPTLKNKRILIIATHPDDAELAAFGVYSQHDTTIVTITAGDSCEPGDHKYSHIYPDLQQHYLEKGKLRTWDSIFVPMLGHVPPSQSINLGYFDGCLGKMYKAPETIIPSEYSNLTETGPYRIYNQSTLLLDKTVESTWNNLIQDLTYIIEQVKPDIIMTPHPLLDAHHDHQYSTVAVTQALAQVSHKDCLMYLYANHYYSMTSTFPYGPAHSIMSLSPWFNTHTIFPAVYSHPLTMDEQKRKLFAIGAIHDLRPAPESENKVITWRDIVDFLKWRNVSHLIKGINHSYYRRGIRANELFVIADLTHTQKLVDRFLQKVAE